MAKCEWADVCPFFNAEVGYSPELHRAMRAEYCLCDNTACARLLTMFRIGIGNVPDEMLPTDADMIDEIERHFRERGE